LIAKEKNAYLLATRMIPKGYFLSNPETKKLIILKSVIFDEALKWNWPDDLTQQSFQENFPIQEIREEIPLDLGSSSSIKPS